MLHFLQDCHAAFHAVCKRLNRLVSRTIRHPPPFSCMCSCCSKSCTLFGRCIQYTKRDISWRIYLVAEIFSPLTFVQLGQENVKEFPLGFLLCSKAAGSTTIQLFISLWSPLVASLEVFISLTFVAFSWWHRQGWCQSACMSVLCSRLNRGCNWLRAARWAAVTGWCLNLRPKMILCICTLLHEMSCLLWVVSTMAC